MTYGEERTRVREAARAAIETKMTGLYQELVAAVKLLMPKSKLRGGFKADTTRFGNRCYFAMLGVEVKVEFVAERKGNHEGAHNGNVRIIVGDYIHSRRFNDKKNGHDIKGLAQAIVDDARNQVLGAERESAHQLKKAEMEAIAARINKTYGGNAESYQPPYVSVHHGTLQMEMPSLNQERAERLLKFMKEELGL